MRVLFMGTPSIAAECLEVLAASRHEVLAVVCQPDRPVGRRYVMTPPPVKVKATELGIPCHQPESLRDGALLPLLDEVRPDVAVVLAYGRILPKYVLEYPRFGCLNLHVSLLPKYRGAAPMQRAIMAGERETGVCVMYMDEGLDTGDILSVVRFPIGPADDLGVVEAKSASLGAEALVKALDALEEGRAERAPQPAEGSTYAAKITKEDCLIDFAASGERILSLVRGLSPAPLAVTYGADGLSLKILSAAPCEGADEYGRRSIPAPTKVEPGTVLSLSDRGNGEIVVAAGDGPIRILALKPEGKGAMSAADFIRGRRIAIGDVLGKK